LKGQYSGTDHAVVAFFNGIYTARGNKGYRRQPLSADDEQSEWVIPARRWARWRRRRYWRVRDFWFGGRIRYESLGRSRLGSGSLRLPSPR